MQTLLLSATSTLWLLCLRSPSEPAAVRTWWQPSSWSDAGLWAWAVPSLVFQTAAATLLLHKECLSLALFRLLLLFPSSPFATLNSALPPVCSCICLNVVSRFSAGLYPVVVKWKRGKVNIANVHMSWLDPFAFLFFLTSRCDCESEFIDKQQKPRK